MMKMNIHRLIGWVIPAALAVFAASCGREPVLDMDKDGRSLMISPALLDLQVNSRQVRALTADDLKDNLYNENVVSRLDVFFFNGTTLAKAYHITTDAGTVSHGGKTGYLLSDDWADDGLQKNTAYTVYVVANSTDETVTTATSGVTPESLMALSHTDADIYKRYNASTEDNTYTKTKSFLMNAKVASWTITSSGTQLVSDNTITLERAAVKFVLDVSLSEEFADRLADAGETYGQPSWKYINFNTVTPEVPGATTAPDAALATGGSGAYLTVVPGTGDLEGHYTVNTYAYPQTWTAYNAIDAAPAIFLSFPCTHGTSTAYHYYYIPICANTTTSTVRNNLYRVKAIISSYGSSEAITGTDVNLTYEVMPWGTSNTADIEAVANDYILATPSLYVFKGGSTTEMLSTQIKYYASGDVTVDTESIYAFYTDKNGNEVEITGTDLQNVFTIERTTTGSSGYFTVSSLVPTNGTYREIHFTVKCGNKSQVVKIRHYPLDFITAEDGAYSTYDFTGWVTPGVNSTYSGSSSDGNYFYFSTDGGIFDAHIFDNNIVKYLNANGTVGSQVNNTPLTNNQMYILQITSANDTYTIGRPTLTSNTGNNVYRRRNNNNYTSIGTVTYYTSNDNVISPGFMLGSQLGAVSTVSSARFAAMHCALYKEFDGTNTWTGWRLPTKQEVQYMMDNQNTYTDVMAEVVSGAYYWTLDGGYAYNSSGSGGSADGSKYVRCVRDLTEAELAEINKFD